MPTVREVAVHHVTEKAMKVVKPALSGRVGGCQAEMPLAHNACVIARFLESAGKRRHRGIEIPPGVVGMRADHAGHAHPIGIHPGQECGA